MSTGRMSIRSLPSHHGSCGQPFPEPLHILLSFLLVFLFRIEVTNSQSICSSLTRVVAAVSGNGATGAEFDTGLDVYAESAVGVPVNGSMNTVRCGQMGTQWAMSITKTVKVLDKWHYSIFLDSFDTMICVNVLSILYLCGNIVFI